MSALRLFRDGSRLEFGKGHLDQWSVYLVRPHQAKVAATEVEGLTWLAELAPRHGPRALYEDFTVVYNRTNHQLQPYVFDLIHGIARAYDRQSLKAEVALAVAYAGMVASERRHRSRPGSKRQLRLGVHLVLIEGQQASAAAALLKAQPWARIDAACAARGF
jgi:hypothetical protein